MSEIKYLPNSLDEFITYVPRWRLGMSVPSEEEPYFVIAETANTTLNIVSVEFDQTYSSTIRDGLSNFKISLHEPSGVNLFDAIIKGANLKKEKNLMRIPYILSLAFSGYDCDGQPKNEGYQYHWRIGINNIDAEMGPGGGIYTIQAYYWNEYIAFENPDLGLDSNITLVGETMQEILFGMALGPNPGTGRREVADAEFEGTAQGLKSEFMRIVNGKYGDVVNGEPQNVIYEIDFDIRPLSRDITDVLITEPDPLKWSIDPGRGAEVSNTSQEGFSSYSDILGRNVYQVVLQKSSIAGMIRQLMSKFLESRTMVFRRDDSYAVVESLKEEGRGLIDLIEFTVEPQVEVLGWDDQLKKYRYRITYIVWGQPTMVAGTNPFQDAARLRQHLSRTGRMHKRYRYLFTGANDGVLNLQINFNKVYHSIAALYGTDNQNNTKEGAIDTKSRKDTGTSPIRRVQVGPNATTGRTAPGSFTTSGGSANQISSISVSAQRSLGLVNKQSSVTTSDDIVRQTDIVQERLPVERVAVGNNLTSFNTSNTINLRGGVGTTTRYLHDILNSHHSYDMLRIELEIVGDPYWLAPDNWLTDNTPSRANPKKAELGFDLEINYPWGDECANQGTASVSLLVGVYRVYQASHSFRNGMFVTKLIGTKVMV